MAKFFLLPFVLLLAFVNVFQKPDRVLRGSDVAILEPAGTWEKAAPLPSYRYEFASTLLGKDIYVMGGVYLPSVWFPTTTVEIYSTETDTWRRGPDLPRAAHHPGAATCAGTVYLVAGNWVRIIPSPAVYALNVAANVWERKADLPLARAALGVACVENKLYAIGGGRQKSARTEVHEYDPKTDTWTEKAPMPTAREHVAVAVHSGKIHVIGGYGSDRFHNLATHEVYDPKTDTWTSAAPLPYEVSGFSAAPLGRYLYVFGGEQGWAVSAEVHRYDPSRDRWDRMLDLPVGRYALTATTVGDRIHLIGGNPLLMGYDFSHDHDVFIPSSRR